MTPAMRLAPAVLPALAPSAPADAPLTDAERVAIDGAGRRGAGMVHPLLEVRPSPIAGLGLFARRKLGVGTVVVIWGGQVYSHAAILAGAARFNSVVALSPRFYLGTPTEDGPTAGECLNHACDPSAWLAGPESGGNDGVTVALRRDVVAGEEVTLDYGTLLATHWAFNRGFRMRCRCAAPSCRGAVALDRRTLLLLALRYGVTHLAPYLSYAP